MVANLTATGVGYTAGWLVARTASAAAGSFVSFGIGMYAIGIPALADGLKQQEIKARYNVVNDFDQYNPTQWPDNF
jgi:hypothetical protein